MPAVLDRRHTSNGHHHPAAAVSGGGMSPVTSPAPPVPQPDPRAAPLPASAPSLRDSVTPSLPFSPPISSIPSIVNELADPLLSLADIAQTHDTSILALTLWMQHPHIQPQLAAIEAAFAFRLRLQALNILPTALDSLQHHLLNHTYEESHVPHNHGDARSHELRRRSRESARRAASLLARFASPRFLIHPPGAPPTSQPPGRRATPELPSSVAAAEAAVPASPAAAATPASNSATIPVPPPRPAHQPASPGSRRPMHRPAAQGSEYPSQCIPTAPQGDTAEHPSQPP